MSICLTLLDYLEWRLSGWPLRREDLIFYSVWPVVGLGVGYFRWEEARRKRGGNTDSLAPPPAFK